MFFKKGNEYILTWKYIKFRSLLTSGANTSTVFSYISTLLGCSFDFGYEYGESIYHKYDKSFEVNIMQR